MITISLCMIVKNEEGVLARCLDSVKRVVDEIIIVDTGSEDKTKEIALAYTDKVFDFKWVNDFSKARNFAFFKASMQYQMWLDADDVLPEEEAEKLEELKKNLSKDIDLVTMKYHTNFDEFNQPILTSTRERLFKKSKHYIWVDPIHEYIPITGKVLNSDITVFHKKPLSEKKSHRNIMIYEERLKNGEEFNPRSTYYFARELMDHERYEEAAEWFEKFLRTKEGWVEDNIASCFNLGKCYRMLKDVEKERLAYVRSFLYDLPRAEVCCELAYSYKYDGDYEKAAYWFESALLVPSKDGGGFVLKDYLGYIPHIELCVCYFNLKDFERAKKENELAAEFKPNAEPVKLNRQLFDKMGKEEPVQ